MTIASNIETILEAMAATARSCGRDPASIRLLAVSKRHPCSSIEEAMKAGQCLFGESYIQEAATKCLDMDPSVSFHFIGHIQSNKAKQAAQLFTMVESLDRYKLAKALNKHLKALGRTLDVLIQVNIGHDPNKSGIAPEEAPELLKQISALSQIRPLGLMTIPPRSQDRTETRLHFKNLRLLGQDLAHQDLFYDNANLELSMGMSSDFTMAIEEGATIIRIGTAIFGDRP